ncbi:ABC transporter ATP-binding protein/permease [[Pseudomonas] carboxydohydrogena]|uniref:ABC transporter ATP-binding protein/permease n=1 Tax=Afipia carboxydohydrogena TaxID=290 RepID=A0ABY8BQD3_AFICR|nr:ABC transporter ATP-binding protein [[Pseudomonas] carboxydohydrogena]WEF51541.1 ABC transporter ATP-binding protein/permease [[Pseudomonas] carboxydohydrogena]
MPSPSRKITDDPYGSFQLIKRLVAEQGALYWRRYLIVFFLMAIGAAASAGSAYLFGKVINQAYVYRSINGIMIVSMMIVGLFTAKGVATYFQAVMLSRISNAILANNQRRLFAKMMQESIGFYAQSHSSDYLNRLSAGAASITQVLSLIMTTVGKDFLTLVGLVAVMVSQDPLLSLLSLVVAPPMFLFVRKIVRRVKSLAASQFLSAATIMEAVQESLQGIRTVKAFTLEGTMQARVDRSVAEVEAHANKMAVVSNRSAPLMEMLGGIAIAGALMYGGYRVIGTNAAPGQFVSFITAFLLAYEPAKRLARVNIDLSGMLIGARMLLEIVDSPASEPDDSNKPALKLTHAQVEFRDVTFAYRPEQPVLKSMNFIGPPGKVTALVGPSGGGKSTILSLLLRFYEVGEGAVVIDGQQISDCSRVSLRRQTAYVGQDVYLFRGSIRENIAFGKLHATEEEIVAAARAAFAHDFIVGFPQGYDTPVGEHGTQLSGGQRQRVAIARALIKDAPIILLDEATAALDSESEKFVQEAIARLCRDRTTIVIAHRLHTIMHADQILVVEDGEIVESGVHGDLLRKGGRYAAFFRLQQDEAARPSRHI